MQCSSCAAINPAINKYCGACGHPFESGVPSLDSLVNVETEQKEAFASRDNWVDDTMEIREELHQALFENNFDAIFLHDQKGNAIDFNRQACEFLGYSRDELLKLNVQDINSNFDYERFLKLVNDLVPGHPSQFETELLRKDGTILPVEVRNTLLILGGRKIIVAVTRDITQRKLDEEALRESETRLRSFMENIPSEAAFRDLDGRYFYINKHFAALHGKKVEELIGCSVHDIYPFEEAENIRKYDKVVVKSGQPLRTEWQWAGLDGIERIYHETRFPVFSPSGDISAIGILHTDISDHKRAEKALALSESRFRAFLDNATAQATFRDLDGHYLFVNRLFAETNQMEVEEAQGKTAHDIFPGERADAVDAQGKQVLDAGVPCEREFEVSGRDGTTRLILGMMFPVFASEGNIVGLGTISRDITEQKRTQIELEKAYGVIKTQKERMENELNFGAEIQLSMIPLIFPPFPEHDEFSIFASLEPAREVAGDFYDFFFIDTNRLCFCIGDVSGKGVPAALFMAITKTLIKSRASDDPSTASILTSVNDELARENKSSLFVTVFLGILDIVTGELKITNAGHNPPYIKRSNGDLQRLDDPHGLILGVIEGTIYEEHIHTLSSGDFLFLYTDGVTEEQNETGDMFTEDRLVDLLRSNSVNSDKMAVEKTIETVRNFRGSMEQSDDITLLSIRFAGGLGRQPSAGIEMVLQNDLSEIETVRAGVEAFMKEHALPKKTERKLNLILDDFLHNVISYGFREARKHEIGVRIDVSPNHITATITDDGAPFNPLTFQHPDTSAPLEQRELGGLGIHLAKSLADEIVYHRRIDQNVLTIRLNMDDKGNL